MTSTASGCRVRGAAEWGGTGHGAAAAVAGASLLLAAQGAVCWLQPAPGPCRTRRAARHPNPPASPVLPTPPRRLLCHD